MTLIQFLAMLRHHNLAATLTSMPHGRGVEVVVQLHKGSVGRNFFALLTPDDPGCEQRLIEDLQAAVEEFGE